jgi:hypothetical protein
MKRIKVKITDKNTFFREFADGSFIGGSYDEPKVVTISLNENEFNALSLFMGEVSDLRHDVALFKFSQCCVLTDWHRRIICKTFPQITENVKIEIL